MRLVCAALLLPSLTACGGAQKPDELIARATVLADKSHGPQLCVGMVLSSLPPQCGGPDLVDWSWAKAGGSEKRGNTRWGDYVVIGTYDQAKNTFTLTHPAVPEAKYTGRLSGDSEPTRDFSTPCKKPTGGWRVVDPTRTNERSENRTVRAAESRPDFGELWVDQSINPADHDGDITEEEERLLNDPAKLILNVAVTGHIARAEADLRKTWGGPLCVSRAKHTHRELKKVQDSISLEPDYVLGVGIGHDVVEVDVIWDDGLLQSKFDQRFGRGTVKLNSALTPYEE